MGPHSDFSTRDPHDSSAWAWGRVPPRYYLMTSCPLLMTMVDIKGVDTCKDLTWFLLMGGAVRGYYYTCMCISHLINITTACLIGGFLSYQ